MPIEYIAHRINRIDDLLEVPTQYGIEVDLRDCSNMVYMHHDPFAEGENFENYLNYYKHKTIILNIKSEGIEWKIIELLREKSIKNYFFLDSSFPMIYKLVESGESRVALRFSELEGIDTIAVMRGKVKWIWVDYFTKIPLDHKTYRMFIDWGYKICLVSPDLVGREDDIACYKEHLTRKCIVPDAICTKIFNINRWK